MNVNDNFMFPVFLPKALELMGIEGLNQRHITVLVLISKGYMTTRKILLATAALQVPPKHYSDVIDCIHTLHNNGLIHYDNTAIPNFNGKQHAVVSMTLEGYTFMAALNRKVLWVAKKEWQAKIKPFSRRGIS